MSKKACKPCEHGECENDVNACRNPTSCPCCGDEDLLQDQDRGYSWGSLDSSD